MKICFIADARSPIARNWIGHFIRPGNEVHVISSYPCSPDSFPGATVHQLPIAFAGFYREEKGEADMPQRHRSRLSPLLARIKDIPLAKPLRKAHDWLAPLELYRHVRRARELMTAISPDLVHAMRIPYEGMLAGIATPDDCPLLISVWGNDFTLIARQNALLARHTRRAMGRASALHCDCRRDLELAVRDWGFRAGKPAAVLPGAGGIQQSLFYCGAPDEDLQRQLDIPVGAPVVINPRGLRRYVRNDAFFQAIPLVLREFPEAVFINIAMKDHPMVTAWVGQYGIQSQVRLLPVVPREQMARLFRLAQVTVSPSLHDGTPNTLLEAMACGCFPAAGDIDSVREWITDGVNGLLFDPTDPEAIAVSVIHALRDHQLRECAREHNLQLIRERAEHGSVMRQAENFYRHLVSRHLHSATAGETSPAPETQQVG
jgi:glycosyltransferase involved in cell wall biosynthesis